MKDIDVVAERARALAGELSIRLRSSFEEDDAPVNVLETVLERNPRHGLPTLVRSYSAKQVEFSREA